MKISTDWRIRMKQIVDCWFILVLNNNYNERK